MKRVMGRATMLARQVRNGDAKGAVADIRSWMWSENQYCGLTRVFADSFEPKPANVELRAAELDATLAAKVFDFTGLDERDATFLDRRRRIWEAGFDNGFVALAPGDEPAYLQWLIPPSQNDMVADYFGPLFPLDDHTLTVEGAWIPPKFRKEKVMGEGLSLVTEAAASASPEADRARCFPELANKGAVRGSMSGGYRIDTVRTDTWRLGRRTVTFEPTTAEAAGY